MSVDLIARVIVAGLILAVPSYWLGTAIYSGRTFSRHFLAIFGAVIYGVATVILCSALMPLAASIGVGVIAGIAGFLFVPLTPGWQEKFKAAFNSKMQEH
jgi:hypothetical protein